MKASQRLKPIPRLGHLYDDRHRFVLTRRFPYVIYFRTEATATLVVAVAHESQKPNYWRKRR
jgi:hypothetical protein